MKFRRFASGLIFGLGCAFSFLGLMAIILPAIENPQMQLVLAGFEMSSAHPVVDAINRFMRFVFAQNWRVLYLGLLVTAAGALLLLRFTPKPKAVQEPKEAPPAPQPVQPEPAEKPNPYARVTYHQPQADEKISCSFHQEPILERNVIDTPEPEPVVEVQPYFSPRFTFESRAMETETGSPSQSGSRILIRNTPEPIAEPEIVSPEPAPPSPAPAAPPTARMTSPRIRSTMGRHTH